MSGRLQNIIRYLSDSFIWAAKRGDLVALRSAVRAGDSLDTVDSQGWTASFHAAHLTSLSHWKLVSIDP